MNQIILCCSFAPLTFDYDYIGLSSFDPLVDQCIFLNSGINQKTIDIINSQFTVPVTWINHKFVDFSTMRNTLINKAKQIPDSFIFMIDDCYVINCSYTKEQLKQLIKNKNCLECDFECQGYKDRAIKLFKSDSFTYILKVHEILCPSKLIIDKVATNIKILDIPDYDRSHQRALRDIEWMEFDLQHYSHESFIKAHLCIYLADAYFITGNKDKSTNYYRKVIEIDGPYLLRARYALQLVS